MFNISNTGLQPIVDVWTQNSSQSLLEAGLFILILTIVFVLIYRSTLFVVQKIAVRTKNWYDDTIVETLKALKTPLFFVVGLYLASQSLILHSTIVSVIKFISYFTVIYYLTKLVYVFIDKSLARYKDENVEDEAKETHLDLLRMFSKIILIVIAVITFLANVGVNVTSLIAGLGIGGIAIAFALQQVLSDVFSSLSIYFDRPFEKGDFIIVGTDMGVVRKIGIQTTRLKTLQGQMLSIPNSELSKSRINNYKRMRRRRVAFNVGCTYDTPVAKVEKIPAAVKKIVDDTEKATFDRTHFMEFGSSDLNFEIVYFVETSDYTKYMDIQQHVNLELMRYFEKNKIEFAFPTQTIHVHKDEVKKQTSKKAKK